MWRGPRGDKEGSGPGVFLELSLGGLGGGQVGVGGRGRLSRDVASGLALSPWASGLGTKDDDGTSMRPRCVTANQSCAGRLCPAEEQGPSSRGCVRGQTTLEWVVHWLALACREGTEHVVRMRASIETGYRAGDERARVETGKRGKRNVRAAAGDQGLQKRAWQRCRYRAAEGPTKKLGPFNSIRLCRNYKVPKVPVSSLAGQCHVRQMQREDRT